MEILNTIVKIIFAVFMAVVAGTLAFLITIVDVVLASLPLIIAGTVLAVLLRVMGVI